MTYYQYAKNPRATEFILLFVDIFLAGLVVAFVNTFKNNLATIIAAVILAALIAAYFFYSKTRLYGVFLYENTLEISGFKKLGLINLSEITDYSYLAHWQNEPTIWFYTVVGRGAWIPYSIGATLRLFKKKKGYYTGGARLINECVRLQIERNGITYIVVFSLDDNAAFLNDLASRIAEAKEQD